MLIAIEKHTSGRCLSAYLIAKDMLQVHLLAAAFTGLALEDIVTQPAAVLKLRSRCLGRQRRQTDALWFLLDAQRSHALPCSMTVWFATPAWLPTTPWLVGICRGPKQTSESSLICLG